VKDENRLFIGGLTFTTSREELLKEFSKYGTVTDLKVPVAQETGMIKGFCFLTMSSIKEAKTVMEQLDGAEYGGRIIGVKKYVRQVKTKA